MRVVRGGAAARPLHARRAPARSGRRSCSAPGCSRTCSATAGATTWCTPPRSPTSRCSPPRPCGGYGGFRAASWTGTRSGRASYWREYLGPRRGGSATAVQRLLRARAPARLLLLAPARRAAARRGAARRAQRCSRASTPAARAARARSPPSRSVVFAGRHIPEKRVPALVEAMPALRARAPELRLDVFGDGPDRARRGAPRGRARASSEVVTRARLRGSSSEVEQRAAPRALHGAPVAAARATGWWWWRRPRRARPAWWWPAPDNAAVELVDEGENGFVAPLAPARATSRTRSCGCATPGPRCASPRPTGSSATRARLSLASSLDAVLAAYRSSRARRRPSPIDSR